MNKVFSLWNLVGLHLIHDDDFILAEQLYKRIINLIKEKEIINKKRIHKGMYYHNLANSLINQDKEKEAIDYYKRAYEEDKIEYKDKAKEQLAYKTLKKLGVKK